MNEDVEEKCRRQRLDVYNQHCNVTVRLMNNRQSFDLDELTKYGRI